MYSSDFFSVDLERADGEYTYHATAADNAGNRTKSPPLTLVFKSGYALPKEEMIQDKTPPKVEIYFNLDYSKLCASISDFEPGNTRILEAALLDGTKVVSSYAPNPATDTSLHNYLSGREESLCITNLPRGKLVYSSSLPGLTDSDIPTSETLAAVKNVVVVAKDFAGNEARIAYVDTQDFKKLSEDIKSLQKMNRHE